MDETAMPDQPADITRLLQEFSAGDEAAFNEAIPLLYRELQDLAGRAMRHERRDQTLDTTGLVHEAFLRLQGQRQVEWQDRRHFLAVAARMMRRILVDHARRRAALKRGGLQERVSLDESRFAADAPAIDLAALDDALKQLAQLDERQAKVVELRFFGGLTVEETAEVLEMSPATVKREWTVAKAWLRRAMTDGDTNSAA
jgi:RNA polymerase sigma factor (TIGR02999 family)